MTPKQKKIYDMQSPAVRKLMDLQMTRKPEEDWDWITRPIPPNYLAVPDAKSLDELVALRTLTYQEAAVYQRMRYAAGERIEEMRPEPIVRSSIDQEILEERKRNAIKAFMDVFSTDVIKERFKKLMGDIFKPSHAEIMADGLRKMNEGK